MDGVGRQCLFVLLLPSWNRDKQNLTGELSLASVFFYESFKNLR